MDILDLIKLYTRLRKKAEGELLEALGFGNMTPAQVDLLVEEAFNDLASDREIDSYDLGLLLRLHAQEKADRGGRRRPEGCAADATTTEGTET